MEAGLRKYSSNLQAALLENRGYYARQSFERFPKILDLKSACHNEHAQAKNTFGEQGLYEMAALIGEFHLTCTILNLFDIPAALSDVANV